MKVRKICLTILQFFKRPCLKKLFNYGEVKNTPFLTAPARVQYFTGVRPGVTWVQPRSPGCTDLTMKSVGVHSSQPEIQNLVKVEISALKSD